MEKKIISEEEVKALTSKELPRREQIEENVTKIVDRFHFSSGEVVEMEYLVATQEFNFYLIWQ